MDGKGKSGRGTTLSGSTGTTTRRMCSAAWCHRRELRWGREFLFLRFLREGDLSVVASSGPLPTPYGVCDAVRRLCAPVCMPYGVCVPLSTPYGVCVSLRELALRQARARPRGGGAAPGASPDWLVVDGPSAPLGRKSARRQRQPLSSYDDGHRHRRGSSDDDRRALGRLIMRGGAVVEAGRKRRAWVPGTLARSVTGPGGGIGIYIIILVPYNEYQAFRNERWGFDRAARWPALPPEACRGYRSGGAIVPYSL